MACLDAKIAKSGDPIVDHSIFAALATYSRSGSGSGRLLQSATEQIRSGISGPRSRVPWVLGLGGPSAYRDANTLTTTGAVLHGAYRAQQQL